MSRQRAGALSIFGLSLLLSARAGSDAVSRASGSPPSQALWTLVWRDEFDGPNGSPPDPAKWTYAIGGNGWGNRELETYTNRHQNVFVRDGVLTIQVLHQPFAGPDGIRRDYTSARLRTQGLFQQTYGRFEARIRIPFGQGVWPAFWMLGADIGQVGWPKCGEIDVMENIGREPSMIHGTIHGPGYSGGSGVTATRALSGGKRFADDFHVFAVEWEPSVIRFYVDDSLYETTTPSNLPKGAAWVFDHPFYLLLNVAVGGNFPGSPDSTTVFPQTMQVDYVRVYRRDPPGALQDRRASD